VLILLISSSVISISGIDTEQSIQSLPSGKTLYVGGSGPGNYTKIQDAINDSSDGDTVFVFNGTYNEYIVVNKSVSIIGQDKNTTVIDGGKPPWTMKIKGDNVKVIGFTFQNDGIIIEANYVNISHNIIKGEWCVGVSHNYNRNIISDNILYSNDNPMKFSISNYNIISKNKIFIAKSDGVIWGIRLTSCKYNKITNNIIVGSACYGTISLENSNKNEIRNNTLIHYGNYNLGIDLFWSYNNYVINNSITDYDVGICLTGILPGLSPCWKNIVTRNTISGAWVGISLGQLCRRNTVSFNNITNNRYGIIISGLSNTNKILNNNFLDNNINAKFTYWSSRNIWDGNFWDMSRESPYPIYGNTGMSQLIVFTIGMGLFSIILFIHPNPDQYLDNLIRVMSFTENLTTLVNFDFRPAQEPYDIEV
jgi:parallel beta-helix repeat protein